MENKNHYYVVEFLNPHTDFDKFVCVPASWMGLRHLDTHTAVIKYPTEEVSVTKQRVENKENFEREWPTFEVYVKFGGDTYEYANKYITFLHNISLITEGVENIDLKIKTTETKSKEFSVDPNSKEHDNSTDSNLLEQAQSNTKSTDSNNTNESHDLDLNESTSKLSEKHNPLLTKLKNMDSSLESRCKHIERALHEHKQQSMIIKSMIKSMENFDGVFNDFIADISHSTTELSVNDKSIDNDVIVTDNDDQNAEGIKDRGRRHVNGKGRSGIIVLKKRRCNNMSSDSDCNDDRPKRNLEKQQGLKSPNSNVHVKAVEVRNRKKISKESFYRNKH